MTTCAYTLHQTTTVSNQTSHSPATGVDECAEDESCAELLPEDAPQSKCQKLVSAPQYTVPTLSFRQPISTSIPFSEQLPSLAVPVSSYAASSVSTDVSTEVSDPRSAILLSLLLHPQSPSRSSSISSQAPTLNYGPSVSANPSMQMVAVPLSSTLTFLTTGVMHTDQLMVQKWTTLCGLYSEQQLRIHTWEWTKNNWVPYYKTQSIAAIDKL
ncbi:hypothetical protein M422DRAFT_247910 [Sphaerobolus stellatus SS14]|nr:hypothetical protein M422DRAFT_247910 [Sphaerobolus stellatus SS14]